MDRKQPTRSVRSKLTDYLVVLSALCLGLFLNFHQTLLSGFASIQGGSIDSRLNNFVLEHSYRWLFQFPHHQSLLHPGILASKATFFGFTDTLLGLAPFFWIWRAAGFDPETSYQLWMMTLAAVNFLACFVLLRRFLKVEVAGASLASLIFAFNTAQMSRVMHQQLIPQFYVIGSIMALFMIFNSRSTAQVRRIGILFFFLAWVAQFYSSFYNFFLLGLPFGAVLIWALFVSRWRRAILGIVREHYLCILFSAGLALALVWPLLSLYLWRIENFGFVRQPLVRPKVYIWFLTDKNNLLYGWIRSGPFSYLRGGQFSQGVGFVTAAAACAGLLLFRRWTCIRVILAGFITTFLVTTYLTDTIAFWPYLREIIPGAKAIRTTCRIGMIQLIPVAIGMGLLLSWASRNRRWPILVLVSFVCLLEQVNTGGRTLSKREVQEERTQLANQVDPDATAFLLTPAEKRSDLAELAKWVALTCGKPTLNLRSLNRRLFSPGAEKDALAVYLEWLGRRGIEKVQLVEVRPRSTEP